MICGIFLINEHFYILLCLLSKAIFKYLIIKIKIIKMVIYTFLYVFL